MMISLGSLVKEVPDATTITRTTGTIRVFPDSDSASLKSIILALDFVRVVEYEFHGIGAFIGVYRR